MKPKTQKIMDTIEKLDLTALYIIQSHIELCIAVEREDMGAWRMSIDERVAEEMSKPKIPIMFRGFVIVKMNKRAQLQTGRVTKSIGWRRCIGRWKGGFRMNTIYDILRTFDFNKNIMTQAEWVDFLDLLEREVGFRNE